MSKIRIVRGGVQQTFLVGGNIKHFYDTVEAWQKHNPTKLAQKIFGIAESKLDLMSDLQFLSLCIKRSNISKIVLYAMESLHNKIAIRYLEIIDTYKATDKTNKLELKESDEKRPANYTSAVKRIANMSFMTPQGVFKDQIKGFCPFEPVVRLNQLIDFPIHLFADNAIMVKSQPIYNPPSLLEPLQIDSIYGRLLSAKPCLMKWELYYIDIAHRMNAFFD